MDEIFLKGVRLFGRVGFFDHEKTNGQEFVLDIVLQVDLKEAGESDDLEKTVSYADVFDDAKQLMDTSDYDLVETYAERLAQLILKKYQRVNRVVVSIGKPDAPIVGSFESVGVRIERGR